MRSLYSGVSGLKTHQTKMDVIGNNIANVNTTAFKSSTITFSELMSQTTQSASGANATSGTGGTNAKQIGLGVKTGVININITGQGSPQSTGNPLDIKITGNAFFIVNNGNENFFTRDGSFYTDGAGNLAMTSTGYNVMGWGVDDTTGEIKKDSVTALRIMSAANLTSPPEATYKATVSGIIDKNDTDVTSANGKVMNLNFYDNLGYSYTAKLILRQSDNAEEYSVEVSKILDSEGNEIDISALSSTVRTQAKQTAINFDSSTYVWNGTELQTVTGGEVIADIAGLFNADGSINTEVENAKEMVDAIATAYGYEGSTEEFLNLYINDSSDSPMSIGAMLSALSGGGDPSTDETLFPSHLSSFEVDGRFYEGSFISFDTSNGKFAGVNGNETNSKINLNLSALGGNFSNIEVDFSDTSMYDNKGTSTVGATSGDSNGIGSGRTLGKMIGVSVQKNGMIYATYNNGMTKLLGQIATAEFANASGLEKAGDNLYSATLNSGAFDGIGVDLTASGGYMSTGQLEMSNVDLSSEFTEMIITQRGFQANSRIITVSDTLLEELTNLKR